MVLENDDLLTMVCNINELSELLVIDYKRARGVFRHEFKMSHTERELLSLKLGVHPHYEMTQRESRERPTYDDFFKTMTFGGNGKCTVKELKKRFESWCDENKLYGVDYMEMRRELKKQHGVLFKKSMRTGYTVTNGFVGVQFG